MAPPNRSDRKFLFDGAAVELGFLPVETTGPTTYNETLTETLTAGDSYSATGGTDAIVSRDFEASSSEYGEIASAIVTAYPFTFAAWVKPESIGTAGVIFSVSVNGSADHYFRVDISAAGANRTRARTTGVSDAISTTTMSEATWHLVTAVFASATERHAYLDGGGKHTSTTSREPAGMNRTRLAGTADTSGTGTFDGLIALPTLWNVALSDADVVNLASGTYPTDVENASIVSHWPLVTGEDTVGSNDWTFTGSATSTDAPPVDPPATGGGTTYNETLTETLTAGDSVAASATFAPALAESVTPGDSQAASATVRPTVTESATPGDSLAASATFAATVSEAVTAGDSNAALATLAVATSEALTPGDSLAVAATFNAARSEGLTAADDFDSSVSTGPVVYNETITESLTAGDSLAAVATHAVTVSETLIAGEGVSASATVRPSVTETVTAGESLAPALVIPVSYSETLTPGDSNAAANAATVTISEGATAGETLTVTAEFSTELAEAATPGDDVSALVEFAAGLEESLSPSDSYDSTVGVLSPGISIEWVVEPELLEWEVGVDKLHFALEPAGPLEWRVQSSLLHYDSGTALHWSVPEADE